jgi:hypothetical protein
MSKPRTAEYRTDVTAWSRAVAEMLRLARRLPDGMERLRKFTAGQRGFCDMVERVEGGSVVVAAIPSARSAAFLEDLRREAEGRAA